MRKLVCVAYAARVDLCPSSSQSPGTDPPLRRPMPHWRPSPGPLLATARAPGAHALRTPLKEAPPAKSTSHFLTDLIFQYLSRMFMNCHDVFFMSFHDIPSHFMMSFHDLSRCFLDLFISLHGISFIFLHFPSCKSLLGSVDLTCACSLAATCRSSKEASEVM